MTVVQWLPYALSGVTIWMTVLQGDKRPAAWLVGLTGQLVWTVWIVLSSTWGFLPLNAALWFLYARNYVKWRTP